MAFPLLRMVTFDATNTLYHLRRPVASVYQEVAKKHGLSLARDITQADFLTSYKATWAKYPNFGQGTQVDSVEWWNKVMRQVYLSAGANEAELRGERSLRLTAEAYEIFASKDGWQLYPEIPGILKSLSERGLVLGVISNNDERVVQILESLEIGKFFKFVMTSRGAGKVKPDPELFREALLLGGIKDPQEALHVGDDLKKDAQGAEKVGMRSFLLTAENRKDFRRFLEDLRT